MVIEAGVVAGYLTAWAVRKARRAGGRLDMEADEVIDAGLDRLHEVVEVKLGTHPVLGELQEEAASGDGEVSELTRQQMELALTAAARKDEAFAQALMQLVAELQKAEHPTGRSVAAGAESAVFTGDAHASAESGGIAFGQVAGNVNVDRSRGDPPAPGRPGH